MTLIALNCNPSAYVSTASTMPQLSRRMRPDVEMMRGRDREADELPAAKNRHAERHIGAVRSAAVRVVMHDHVAGAENVAQPRSACGYRGYSRG